MAMKMFNIGISNREISDYLDKQPNIDKYIVRLIERDMKGYITKEEVIEIVNEMLNNLKVNVSVEKKIVGFKPYIDETKFTDCGRTFIKDKEIQRKNVAEE